MFESVVDLTSASKLEAKSKSVSAHTNNKLIVNLEFVIARVQIPNRWNTDLKTINTFACFSAF